MTDKNNINGTPAAQVVLTERPQMNAQTGIVGTAGGATPVFVGGGQGIAATPKPDSFKK